MCQITSHPFPPSPSTFQLKEYHLLSKLKIFRENDNLGNNASHFITDVALHSGAVLPQLFSWAQNYHICQWYNYTKNG